MTVHTKEEICRVAGHSYGPRSDEYGRWRECNRCGALAPVESKLGPYAPKAPLPQWPTGIRWNYGEPKRPNDWLRR